MWWSPSAGMLSRARRGLPLLGPGPGPSLDATSWSLLGPAGGDEGGVADAGGASGAAGRSAGGPTVVDEPSHAINDPAAATSRAVDASRRRSSLLRLRRGPTSCCAIPNRTLCFSD